MFIVTNTMNIDLTHSINPPAQIFITQTCLLKSLEKAPTAEQEVLSPLTADADVSLHCIRCRSAYTENKNHPSACKIKHNNEGVNEPKPIMRL